jgi:adenine-specific DNA-methyltransferase
MTEQISATLGLEVAAARHGLALMEISNRRYLGSKQKLLGSIDSAIQSSLGRLPNSLVDTFAGSGVVAAYFADLGVPVIANDLLTHNAIALETFLLHSRYNYESLCSLLVELQNLDGLDGYISETFGGKYFSVQNAAKLDAMREYLDENVSEIPLRNAALTSLIYAADKIAQTVGHYDAFFNRESVEKPLVLRAPKVVGHGFGHVVKNMDANLLVREIEAEVNFQDPPYNSRQYSSNYHVLENIVSWKKPEVKGVSAKMDLKEVASKYSTRAAAEAYQDLIEHTDSDLIALTYSNTASQRVSRSNNLLTDDDINRILGAFGSLEAIEVGHKEFSVGRTSNRDHKERIFLAKRGK